MKLSVSLLSLFIFGASASVLHSRNHANNARQAGVDCPTEHDFDYIVVGSGAGGGPLASRLALAGFKVLVVEHGHDVVNVNTTIPLYLARSNEDPQLALDYWVDHYPPDSSKQFKTWYPRASGLGGSTIHNALINVLQVDHDFDKMATTFGDSSWRKENMRRYYQKLENNLYLPRIVGQAVGYGYDGWLSTKLPPINLVVDPKYFDPQLVELTLGISTMMPLLPLADFNSLGSDGLEGGGNVVTTRKQDNTRSSVRDFLAETQKKVPSKLNFSFNTLATKVLMCKPASGKLKAFGVEVASGANLLPVARLFQGKASTLSKKTITAKYEVILSAGVYQTPQLLMLSGIGPKEQLTKFNIPTQVDLPGVGENLMDRLEATLSWKLKQDHVLIKGCKWGDDPSSDPCLQEWLDSSHTNAYSTGSIIWAIGRKSSPNLPFIDTFTGWTPGLFTGYYPGYPVVTANTPNVLSALVLKGHTSARGWVRLTGSDPQDKLEINKNQFVTPESKKDLITLREALKREREAVKSRQIMMKNIVEEFWPGNKVQTDAEWDDWIMSNHWGHHACCTSKMGLATDKMAVIDNNFRVRGVDNLRIVDISSFPEIPGLFVTTPIYMMSEKAADVILQNAKDNGFLPSS